MCVDKPYTLSGDYNSQSVSHLNIQFERCNSEENECMEDEEITEWLRRKFILTLSNEYNFYQGEYDDQKIKNYAKIKWYPINSQQRIEYIN